MKKVLGVLLALTLVAACAPSTPQVVEKEVVVEKPVVETVVVEKEVVVEKPVVETVVVEKPVVITPTPAPPGPMSNTFVFAAGTMELSCDPAVRLGTATVRWARHFYDGLLQFKGATAELEPALATEWEVSEDGLTYTFNLREGVEFHDGCPFNAEAVKTTFDRITGIALGTAGMISAYKETEIVDDYAVKIHLTAPDPAFPMKLPKLYIVSPCAVEAHKTAEDPWAKDWFFDHAAGTGPFKLVEWIHGDRWITERYDDYWQGPAQIIDGTISILVPEIGVQSLLLEGGVVDFQVDVSPEEADRLAKNPDISVNVTEGINLWMIMMNTKHGPLADPKVREAMRWAFDYDAHIEYALGGKGSIARGPVAPGIPGFNEAIPEPHQDLEKAKELLAEAGYPDGGFTLRYIHLPGETGEELRGGEILRDALAKLGITLEMESLLFVAKVALFDDPETAPDMAGLFSFPGYPDPNENLIRYYRTQDQRPAAYNLAFLSNPTLDDLIMKQEREVDPAKRQEMLNEIQRILWEEEIPAIWVSVPHSITATRKWVEGYENMPYWHQSINVYDISLEEKP